MPQRRTFETRARPTGTPAARCSARSSTSRRSRERRETSARSNYSTAKAGLVGLTKTLAREWGAFKVNVNAVAFGFVETRLTAPSDSGETIERGDNEIKLGIPQAMRDLATTIIPLGRAATPEDAAGPIFFLCTPWSNFVHGQVHHREWRPDDGDDDVSGELDRRGTTLDEQTAHRAAFDA